MRSVALRRAVFFWHDMSLVASCKGGPCGAGWCFWVHDWFSHGFFCLKKATSWIIRKWKYWPRNDRISACFLLNIPWFGTEWYLLVSKRECCAKSHNRFPSPHQGTPSIKSMDCLCNTVAQFPTVNIKNEMFWGPSPVTVRKTYTILNTILQEGVLVYKPPLSTFHCFFLCFGQDPRDVSCYF